MAVTTPSPFIPGPRLIDGSELNANLAWPAVSVDAGVTATGNSRATSYQLKAAITQISVAAANSGVQLPNRLQVGRSCVVYNDGASPIQVYGHGTTITIDGVLVSVGVPLANAKRCMYTRISATAWISAQLGAVSA